MVEHFSQNVSFAKEFALRAHLGQKRKYTGEPYFNHVHAVAELVRNVGGSPDMICAAYLHDVVEDTNVPLFVIETMFGTQIAEWVKALTNVDMTLNRATRKLFDLRRLESSCPQVQTIKLADLIDNTHSIVERDPKFAAVYMVEKRDLLAALSKGNPTLRLRAQQLVDAYFRTVPAEA